MDARLIYINGFEFNSLKNYADNYISSTKYNLITFLPKCLFQQFRRIANLYFLAVAILQSIPLISPLQPFSAIAPFVIVLAVSMIREAVEDYRRYRSDKETNSTPAFKYFQEFESIPSYKIKVGDIVLVKKDQVFPCDLIFLSSSEMAGVCFIETSSLDGEKTLKPRQAFAPTCKTVKDKGIIRLFNLIEVEKPNARLYQFHAMIHYNNKKYSLDKNNLLLAGAFLRNTSWVIGVAVYTGTDTKLRMNLMDRTFKQSTIEKKVNKYIIFIIIMQLSLCILPAVLGAYKTSEWRAHPYIDFTTSSFFNGFLLFFTYFLLMNTMLPISLIISLEIAKMIQAFFMQQSLDMYSELREKSCKVFSSSLNEELGMIKHVFTDKTGTLTCNRMKFRFCTIGQRLYGYSSCKLDEGIECFSPNHLEDDLYGPVQGEFIPFRMTVGKIVLEVKDHKQLADQFMKCMTLCHECMVDKDTDKYIGPSPDEIALLETAQKLGFYYKSPIDQMITIKVMPYGCRNLIVKEQFQYCCTLEFNSDRKRNSVIARDMSTGFIMLYTKGADNVIMKRLSKYNLKYNIEKINKDLLQFSKRGYRTLLMAFRIIGEEEYKVWKIKYDDAANAIYDREEQIAALADEIEKDLILLGCTAVEDSLQEQVPETICEILNAGIKVWMLTGDKLETAINIAKTCGLASSNTKVNKCRSIDLERCREKLEKILKKLSNTDGDAILVVEGESLEVILSSNPFCTCIDLFFQVSEKCKTVVCCRVSPGQKKKVVTTVKEKYKSISLSIGDGANDVSMILEANIGVGIYGEEGMQAVQASDFAIGEFRFLWDLILNQGRLNYIRQSEMIFYFFYKNMVFTLPQFYFAFYCFYSGQTVYDDWYITCYNMVFTAVPLMMKAVFDKDFIVDKKSPLFNQQKGMLPGTYKLGRDNMVFTAKNFAYWIFIGFLHSGIVFFVPLFVFNKAILTSLGNNADFWAFSMTSFTSVILLVNIKLSITIRFWTIWHVISILALSVGLYFGFIIVYDMLPYAAGSTISTIVSSGNTFFTIFCVLSMCLCLDMAIFIFQKIITPNPSDELIRKAKKGKNQFSVMPLNN